MWSHIRYGVSRPTKRPSPSRPGHDGETVRQQKHRVRKTRSSGAAPACPGDGYPSILPWRADAAGGLVDEHDRMLLVGVAGAGRGRFSASWRLENRPQTAALRTSVHRAIITLGVLFSDDRFPENAGLSRCCSQIIRLYLAGMRRHHFNCSYAPALGDAACWLDTGGASPYSGSGQSEPGRLTPAHRRGTKR